MTSVPVTNVIPGALVDVFVNGVWKGTVAAGASNITVGVNGRLKVGDMVTARQRLCTMISGFGRTVRVVHSQDRNWPMLHHDGQHTGLATCSDITSSTVGNLVLVTDPVHLEGSVLSVPSIVDGKIYVGTSTPGGGTMYRVDLASGAVEHQFSFATPAGQLSEQGEGGIGCSPAVTGGRVYFSCLDGKVRCLDANTFQPIWVVDLRSTDPAHNQPVTNLGAADARAEGWSSPLVVNNRVYVGFGEGEGDPAAFGFVYCLDANSGNVIWLFCTNQFVAGVDNLPNVVPASTVGGAIPAGFNGFNVQADPPSRGASVWSSCAYHAGLNRIFVGTGNGDPDMPLPNPGYSSGILSLDATTGALQGFFQMAPNDSYRIDDLDTDVPCAPMLFRRGAQDVVTFGGKNGAAFLLDPANFNVLARRQLLPKDGAGNPLPSVDQHVGGGAGENLWGIFGSPAVDPAAGHVYFGLGGYEGIDGATTPFLRACDWNNLADAWPTTVGPDGVTRYTTPTPWMYATSEAGISSPAVVNDVVFVSTTKGYTDPSDPALYAFASSNGTPLWKAPGFPTGDSLFAVGPAVSGNFVVIGAGSDLMIYRL
jgi:outer membrane protein assembly factor BamB